MVSACLCLYTSWKLIYHRQSSFPEEWHLYFLYPDGSQYSALAFFLSSRPAVSGLFLESPTWSLAQLLNSATILQKSPWQDVNEQAWLSSSKTLPTKTTWGRIWLTLPWTLTSYASSRWFFPRCPWINFEVSDCCYTGVLDPCLWHLVFEQLYLGTSPVMATIYSKKKKRPQEKKHFQLLEIQRPWVAEMVKLEADSKVEWPIIEHTRTLQSLVILPSDKHCIHLLITLVN